MFVRIDSSSSVPIFEQIVNQVKYAVAMGAYRTGDKLPSVRELAVDLRVNPNPVARTYRELEREGVIYTQRGLGMFVSKEAETICRRERKRIINERLGDAIEEALRSDLSAQDIRAIVESKLDSRGKNSGRNK